MLKLFRVEHANAEELMKDIEIPHVGDRDVIDREFYDKYRKSEFVILVYAESIEQIKQQYERWDSGGFDPDVYYEAFENGIIKEVETITDLDDVNYCDCNGNYFVDEYLPDVCESKACSEYFKDSDYEDEYVMDFLRKKTK